jgi:cobalt/nickel transport system ATP-binding protein
MVNFRAEMSIAAVEVKNLTCSYQDGTRALKNISFSVRHGERVFIIGPNGAGKSTLFLCLLGFLPFEGFASVAGLKVEKENLPAIRSKAGIVFQDPDDQIFMPSVYEDVSFGANARFDSDFAKKTVEEAIEITGLKGFEKRLAHHLSFGEKKRVAIAGVLAAKPEIIFLDEPTANLDHRHRSFLIDTLKKLDSTLIVATHDMNLVVKLAERIIVLFNGEILADGSPEKILTDKDLLELAFLEPPCQCELSLLFYRL